jgi:hypothetical protein
MPTERELLALCLKWIQHPQGDAFDKAMLIEAVQAKLQPRPWVGLTDEERFEVADISDCFEDVVDAVEALLKEKNQ